MDSLDVADREARKALAADPSVTQTHLILGEVALRKGNLAAARQEFRKALETGGEAAQAHAGLAMAAIVEENWAQAETEAQAALGADKGSWPANYVTGRVLLSKGDVDGAFKAFEKGKGLKTRAQKRDLFETGMGFVALAENDVPGAETNFIKARAMSPNTIWTTMDLASMYEATNQWGQAANVLMAAEAKFGGSPVLSYRLGRAYEKQSQWNDALRSYQKSYKADSTFTPSLAALGHLFLLDSSKLGMAIEVLSRSVADNPTPTAQLDLGTALIRAGRAKDAIPHLEAVNRDHESPETKVTLARAYIAGDDLEKGLPMYADPDVVIESPAADILAVASALIKAKRYEEARPWLDKALEKDPNLSEVYSKRGLIELVSKNYEAALVAFDKKLEMDPKSASTWINKGNTLLALGKKPEAKEAYRKATEVAPNSPAVWLSLGQALVTETPQEALPAFDRALALDPQNVAAKKWKGLTFLVLERYPDSIGLLKEATQADPNDAEGLTWLGNAYLNSGNQTEARVAYQRALKIDPAYKPAQESLQQMNASSQ